MIQTPSLTGDLPDRTNEQVAAAAAVANSAPDSLTSRSKGVGRNAVVRTNLVSLQALRAVAILLVVWHHQMFFMVHRRTGRPLDGALVQQFPVLEQFQFGVDVFFVLSGFLLMLIVKPYLDRRRSLTNFMLHRILRIWPLYIIVTCVVLLREYINTGLHGAPLPADFSLYRFLGFFFIPTFNDAGQIAPIYFPGWTLSYEMLFYSSFALAIRMASNQRELIFALTTIVFGGLLLGHNLPQGSAIAGFLSDPIVIECLIGAGICALLQSGFRVPLQPAWWFAFAFAWIFSTSDLNGVEGWRLGSRGVPAAMLLIAMLKIEGQASFPKWMVAIGNASYSIFLTHDIVLPRICGATIDALDGRLPDAYLGETAAFVALIPTVLFGLAVFHVFEKHLNNVIKDWIGK